MKRIIVNLYDYQQNVLSLREILDILNINVVDKNKPILDAYPRILIDDGMGYGVDDSYITEVSPEIVYDKNLGENVFNVFREKMKELKKFGYHDKVYVVKYASGDNPSIDTTVAVCRNIEKAKERCVKTDYSHGIGDIFVELEKVFDHIAEQVDKNTEKSLQYEEMHKINPEFTKEQYEIYDQSRKFKYKPCEIIEKNLE